MNTKLLTHTTNDGSRWFASMPESCSWSELRDHIAKLSGVSIIGFLTDHVTEVWIDFSYRGHTFSINNQFGEFWFFVREPDCQDDILTEIVEHCHSVLR